MLEGYITPLLMSYINRYVNNIKPSDLKLSFWGGDAVLRNLELRLDVLKKELHIPLECKSGFVRELVIHLPWSSIASTSVEVTIKDLELVVQLKPLGKGSTSNDSLDGQKNEPSDEIASDDLLSGEEIPRTEGDKKEIPPGYLRGYMNRIINNVQVHVQNMVVKVMEEESDFLLTLNVGSVKFFTANKDWQKEFVYTDYFQGGYSLHKVCEVKDVAVNLHPIEIGEKAQGSSLHEPFLKRTNFTCRVKFEYGKKILVRKSFEVLFENLEFSVDEKQFCLFFHLCEWLLAMYYHSKKLKGRDDKEKKSRKKEIVKNEVEHKIMEKIYEPKFEQSVVVDTATDVGVDSAIPEASGTGWGSWLMSMVSGADEDKQKDKMEKNEEEKVESYQSYGLGQNREGVEVKQKAAEFANFHFCMTAKSVKLTLKMTQQVQTPVFLSPRSFASPVIIVRFTDCLSTVDRCPLSRAFMATMGIGRVEADVVGSCPCVKKYPSSWRRLSVAAESDKTVS